MKPLPTRSAVPGPVQPRVVGENLYARPDDEDHQKQIKKLLRTQPCGKGRRFPWADLATPRCCSTNTCTDDNPRKCCAAATAAIRTANPIRSSQGRLNHFAVADAHTRCDAGGIRHRTCPRDRVDDVCDRGTIVCGIFMPQ